VLTDDQYECFLAQWCKIDPDATCFVPWAGDGRHIKGFLQDVEPPMGFGKSVVATDAMLDERFARLGLDLYSNDGVECVYLGDLASRLAYEIALQFAHESGLPEPVLPPSLEVQKKLDSKHRRQVQVANAQLQSSRGVKHYYAALEVYTAHRQSVFCAKILALAAAKRQQQDAASGFQRAQERGGGGGAAAPGRVAGHAKGE
jgi:hypothetical protein